MDRKRQVLFIQGAGEGTHEEWDAKLVASLRRELGEAFDVRYPRMPNEGDPRYARWKPALAGEMGALGDGAILVGHSAGGTILMKTLTELPRVPQFGAICLVAAPFVGKGGWPAEDVELPADLAARLPPGVPVHLYHGLADDVVPPAHVDLWARLLPRAQVHRLPGRDHQLEDDLKEIATTISSLGG